MEQSPPEASDESLHDQQAVGATLFRAEDDAASISSRSGSTTLQDELDAADLAPRQEPSRHHSVFATTVAYLRHGKELVFSERISALLAFVPVGIAVGFLKVGPVLAFILNAVAIIPLAVVISSATENLAGRLGDTFGALLNVTVGNTAELMIFYAALSKNQIRIVQASLLGSVLVNSLLILGSALFMGGLRCKDGMRDRPAVRLSVALLDLGLLISIYPIAFWTATTKADTQTVRQTVLAISRGTSIGLILIYLLYLTVQMRAQSSEQRDLEGAEVEAIPLSSMPHGGLQRSLHRRRRSTDPPRPQFLSLRRGLNLVKWPQWLSLTARRDERGIDVAHDYIEDASHSLLRQRESTDSFDETRKPSWDSISPKDSFSSEAEVTTMGHARASRPRSRDAISEVRRGNHQPKNSLSWALPPSPPMTASDEENEAPRGRRLLSTQDAVDLNSQLDGSTRPVLDPRTMRRSTFRDLHEHRRSRSRQTGTPIAVSMIVLVLAAALASIVSEFAVGAIPAIVESVKISQVFIGFVVLPVVGNAAEHVTAAKLAMHDKFILAKSVAIESSTQVVLLITPAMILVGWARDRDLSLQFDIYEIASVVIASVVASFVVSCGKGNWKQGVLLYVIFTIIAIGTLFHKAMPKLYGREGYSI